MVPQLHPQVRRFVEAAAAAGDPPVEQDTPQAMRARRRSRIRASSVELPVVRDVDADGVRCRFYRPTDTGTLGLFVYFHGGGWVIGDLDTHDGVARTLARTSGHAVLSVDYRLAPEHPFPAALVDAVQATRWAHRHAPELGCDPERLAVGGDSAGGNLATVVAQLSPVPLCFQVLVYPVTDLSLSTDSYREFANGPVLTRAAMAWFGAHYLSGGAGAPGDPRVSPAAADDAALRRCPPGMVVTAECDPLRDEGEAYAARLNALGVPTSVTRYQGTIHAFVSNFEVLDAGRGALGEIGARLAAAFASGERH